MHYFTVQLDVLSLGTELLESHPFQSVGIRLVHGDWRFQPQPLCVALPRPAVPKPWAEHFDRAVRFQLEPLLVRRAQLDLLAFESRLRALQTGETPLSSTNSPRCAALGERALPSIHWRLDRL